MPIEETKVEVSPVKKIENSKEIIELEKTEEISETEQLREPEEKPETTVLKKAKSVRKAKTVSKRKKEPEIESSPPKRATRGRVAQNAPVPEIVCEHVETKSALKETGKQKLDKAVSFANLTVNTEPMSVDECPQGVDEPVSEPMSVEIASAGPIEESATEKVDDSKVRNSRKASQKVLEPVKTKGRRTKKTVEMPIETAPAKIETDDETEDQEVVQVKPKSRRTKKETEKIPEKTICRRTRKASGDTSENTETEAALVKPKSRRSKKAVNDDEIKGIFLIEL